MQYARAFCKYIDSFHWCKLVRYASLICSFVGFSRNFTADSLSIIVFFYNLPQFSGEALFVFLLKEW